MKLQKRRRLEAKTDYKARLSLLKSRKPRLVIRKTNNYIIVQIIKTENAQDKVIFGITSKILLKKGWPKENSGSLKTLPAVYLTGYLLAITAKSKVKEAILDIGMQRNIKKSRIYAALKGILDGGIDVPHSQDSLPTLDEIKKNKKLLPAFNKVLQEIKQE